MGVTLPYVPVPRHWQRLDAEEKSPSGDEGLVREGPVEETLEELANVPCLVLLGEPGLGKSTAVREARKALDARGERCNVRELGSVDGADDVRSMVKEALDVAKRGDIYHLFLDGLDEAVTSVRRIGKTIADELNDLDALQRLRLRVVCRGAALPESLPDSLKLVYGPEQVALYSLQPLRMEDIERLVRAAMRGAPEQALSLIKDPKLKAIVERPITLGLLVGSLASSSRRARKPPETAYEIYDEAMDWLVVDPDPERRDESPNAIPRRREIARMLALLSLLGGRPRILKSAGAPGPQADVVTAGDLAELASPEELKALVESAPLFERDEFAHRSYAEHLAAEALARHASPDEAIQKLFLPGGGSSRVVPQLREVAALLATRQRFFDRLVGRDPLTLLEVEPAFLDDEQRSRLIDAVLQRSDELLHTLGTWSLASDQLVRYEHPGLVDQLTRWITDKNAPDLARRVAIDVAKEAHGTGLSTLLALISLDRIRELPLRVTAAYAVRELGDGEAIRRLRPLIEGDEKDVNDELKGIALRALWPRWLDTAAMLEALKPPKSDRFFGAYWSFCNRIVPEHMSRESVPMILQWCAENVDRRLRWPPEELVKRTLAFAIEHLDDEGMKPALLTYVIAAERAYGEPIPKLAEALQTRDEKTRDARRWALLDLLLPLCDDPKRGAASLWALGQLLTPSDAHALLDRAERTLLSREKLHWIRLAANQERSAPEWELTVVERILLYQSAEVEAPLREGLSWIWEAWPLDAENVKYHRKQRRHEKRTKELIEPARSERAARIEELLSRVLGGDLGVFWEVIYWMNTRVRDDGLVEHWHQIRLAESADWKSMAEDRRRAFLEASAAYLRERGPEADQWFGKDLFHWPAVAGRQAFVLLAERDASLLDTLSRDVWERWLPALFSPLWMSEEAPAEVIHDLLQRAYRAAPSPYQAKALELLKAKSSEYQSAPRIITPVLDAPFIEALRPYAIEPTLPSDIFGDLLGGIGKHNREAASAIAKASLSRDWAATDDAAKRAKRAAAYLLGNEPESAWPLLEPLFDADPARGAKVVQAVEGRIGAGMRWCPAFESASSSASFFRWASKAIASLGSPARNRRFTGAVTPDDVLEWMIKPLLDRLITLGSEGAVQTLEELSREYPDDERVSGALHRAREQFLENTWRGWPVADLGETFCPKRGGEGV